MTSASSESGRMESPARKSERKKRRKDPRIPASGIEDVPDYHNIQMLRKMSETLEIPYPYFRCREGRAKDIVVYDGREFLNFSTYDYLGLNASPEINRAAAKAMDQYGSSASASRLSGGECPPHRRLEREFAEFLGLEDCLSFVGGYTTNVSVLSHLFGPRDLIAYDSSSHNSLTAGASFSGATRFSFPHNDIATLDSFLRENRGKHQRAIIVTEGLFSMDGTVPDVPALVDLKRRHNCFLMLDEAHSIGVLGKTGRGAVEHFGLDPTRIDITMGTLSKTFCGCGGFVAGSRGLVEYLKHAAPGFLYSVAMPPPMAAASLAALKLLRKEPERVVRLNELGQFFLDGAKQRGFDVGGSAGASIVPIMVGDSLTASYLATDMYANGVNVLPVIHPVVEEGAARLRFFITTEHDEGQLAAALDLLAELLPQARSRAAEFWAGTSMEQLGMYV